MKVRIFVTGGTFDKEYDELTGKLFFKDTHLQEMLKLGRCKLEVDVRTLMMIDSLEMTDLDRKTILDHCQQSAEEHIIVTHGTDTMEQTARLLGPAIKNKTIVLTGAMVPYQFGSALAFVQSLPHGVYVAMNGKYFPWSNVTKDKATGEFKKTN
jgi:L-asparaginase